MARENWRFQYHCTASRHLQVGTPLEHGSWFLFHDLVSEKGPLVVCMTAEDDIGYELFDLATGKSVKYPATTIVTQRVYYNPNKYIDTGECTLHHHHNYHQCSVRKGFGHLVRSGKNKIVDLENGTVTTVESHRGESLVYRQPGPWSQLYGAR